MGMTQESAEAFANDWIAAWNRRDAEWVLAHFHDDVVFTSPTAQTVIGQATVHGKPQLRDYWTAALALSASLHFTLDRALWSERHSELAIIYTSVTNGKTKRVSENLRFNEDKQVIAAEVFHGVVLA